MTSTTPRNRYESGGHVELTIERHPAKGVSKVQYATKDAGDDHATNKKVRAPTHKHACVRARSCDAFAHAHTHIYTYTRICVNMATPSLSPY